MAAEDNSSDEVRVIKEGKAEVFFPKHVFYNPVQEFNRDLTISVINQFTKLLKTEQDLNKSKKQDKANNSKKDEPMEVDSKTDKIASENAASNNTKGKAGDSEEGVSILEALAASGLRSVRFGLEVPGVKQITANDFDQSAYEMIQRNVVKNKLDDIVQPSYGDAAMIMYQNKKAYDVIDLDPYGSPSPFLDSTVQSVKDGGLLCITCTDTAVLCGKASETCMAKYGSVSLNAKFCHEMALRITLHSIQSHASRYSRYIVPLISISADFYVRVFVRVFTGQSKVKNVVSKLAMVYHCTGCGSHHLQNIGTKTPTGENNFKYGNAIGPTVPQKCDQCNGSFHIGGPIWKDPIHDLEFVNSVIESVSERKDDFKTSSRIIGMLSLVLEELHEVPLYYVTDRLCGTLHCTSPSILQLRSAIMNAGYEVSMSHCIKNSIKTTAPHHVMWDIMRCWVKQNPVSEKHKKEGTPLKAILDKEPEIEASFEIRNDANPKSRKEGLLRWQVNPEPNWGPKSKASRSVVKETQTDKKLRLQNKRGKTQGEQEENSSNKDFKQFACKKSQQGLCDLGDDCVYSHDINSKAPESLDGNDEAKGTSKENKPTPGRFTNHAANNTKAVPKETTPALSTAKTLSSSTKASPAKQEPRNWPPGCGPVSTTATTAAKSTDHSKQEARNWPPGCGPVSAASKVLTGSSKSTTSAQEPRNWPPGCGPVSATPSVPANGTKGTANQERNWPPGCGPAVAKPGSLKGAAANQETRNWPPGCGPTLSTPVVSPKAAAAKQETRNWPSATSPRAWSAPGKQESRNWPGMGKMAVPSKPLGRNWPVGHDSPTSLDRGLAAPLKRTLGSPPLGRNLLTRKAMPTKARDPVDLLDWAPPRDLSTTLNRSTPLSTMSAPVKPRGPSYPASKWKSVVKPATPSYPANKWSSASNSQPLPAPLNKRVPDPVGPQFKRAKTSFDWEDSSPAMATGGLRVHERTATGFGGRKAHSSMGLGDVRDDWREPLDVSYPVVDHVFQDKYRDEYHDNSYDTQRDYGSGYTYPEEYERGYKHSAEYESGYGNSAEYESGYRNSAEYESGYRNSGEYESGYRNSGEYQSGYKNQVEYQSGYNHLKGYRPSSHTGW